MPFTQSCSPSSSSTVTHLPFLSYQPRSGCCLFLFLSPGLHCCHGVCQSSPIFYVCSGSCIVLLLFLTDNLQGFVTPVFVVFFYSCVLFVDSAWLQVYKSFWCQLHLSFVPDSDVISSYCFDFSFLHSSTM